MPTLRWSIADKEKVRRGWLDGLRAHEIAPLLDGEFTPHAIIKMAKRLGLARDVELPRGFYVEGTRAIHPMWEMDEDERRVEFIMRYERGMAEVRARFLQDKWQERSNA